MIRGAGGGVSEPGGYACVHLCVTYAQLGMEQAMRDKTNYFLPHSAATAPASSLPWLDQRLSDRYELLLSKTASAERSWRFAHDFDATVAAAS